MSTSYICVGTDKRSLEARDTCLVRLKTTMFPSEDVRRFDLEEFDARKLGADDLQAALSALPTLAFRRMIIIFQAEKLNKDCVELLARAVSQEQSCPVMVLIAETWPKKTNAHKDIWAASDIIGQEAVAPKDVFALMDSLKDPARSLMFLKVCLDREEAAEQILGGMVWGWSNKWKSTIPAEKYRKGLLVLQEADDRIKRSRLPERGQALEIAVVKLSWLLKA